MAMFFFSYGSLSKFFSDQQWEPAEVEGFRKKILIYILLSLGCLFLPFLAVLAVSQDQVLLAIADFIMFALYLFLLLFFHFSKRITLFSYLGSFISALFLLFLLGIGGPGNISFIWSYLLPLIGISLLGLKRGGTLVLAFALTSPVVFMLHNHLYPQWPYTPDFLIRFFSSFFIIFIFTAVLEHSRERFQTLLTESRLCLSELARKDSLTGLYNRLYMKEVMDLLTPQLQRSGIPVTLVMIDVDYFKDYNDCYGHPAGDEALLKIAGIFSDAVQRQSDYAFRYGGEEFLLLFSGAAQRTGIDKAEEIIQRVRELALPHRESPYKLLTVSLGIVHSPLAYPEKLERLVEEADKALYRAKAQGRNRYAVGKGEE